MIRFYYEEEEAGGVERIKEGENNFGGREGGN